MPRSFFYSIFLILSLLLPFDSGQAAVLVKQKMWSDILVLNVIFIDGNQRQKELVKRYAPLWLDESALQFQFYDNFESAPPQSHIRVSFESHTGSKLGNHRDYSSRTATLLLNELNQVDLSALFVKRLILHEFGHALGLEHEYRNPGWPYGEKPINEQILNCVPRMTKIGYKPLDAKSKCVEINSPLTKESVNSTIYDEFSVMNYPQSILLADHTTKKIAAGSRLSVLDKLAIQRWYGEKQITNK